MPSLLYSVFFFTLSVFIHPVFAQNAGNNSLRETVAELAGRGLLDSAYQSVVSADSSNAHTTPANEKALLLGKLSLRGDASAKALTTLKAQGKKSPEQAEALYLLGQYQYAAGRYHLAIPEFREYLRRYPQGEDADRAAYWMGNACLHLALTHPDRSAYLDTGLAYLARMPALSQPGAYYAALAAECAARIWLAKGETAAADSVLSQAMQQAPDEEMPALLLLRALWLRTQNQPYEKAIATLKSDFPQSPEMEYVQRLKGKLPKAASISGPSSPTDAAVSSAKPAIAVQQATLDSTYTLQIGSFAQRENAETLVSQLNRKGIKAEIETQRRGQQTLNVVMVGRFANADQAEAQGLSLLKPLKVMYQVRRRP